MTEILEILKYILPSVVVFLTVYYILRMYLNNQYNLQALELRKKDGKDILMIKIQAYERLLMFIERISIDQLAYRLNNNELDVQTLKNAMLIAIQQEYEYNLSQQLYVSNNLWKIIDTTKTNTQEMIAAANGTTPTELVMNITMQMNEKNINPFAIAKMAIKNESSLILDN